MFGNLIVKPKIYQNSSTNKILYGSVDTNEYGQVYLAFYLENETPHIYCLNFANGQTIETFSKQLQKRWSGALCEENDKLTSEVFNKYFTEKESSEICVVLNGSDFQMKVWSALLEIPYGEERTYGEVAEMIDSPLAVRAVATAVGSNNIAILIPCHRVKAKSGDKHKYRWGSDLKKKLLLNENKGK